jgi:DNA-binding response OmpR family regulator
MTSRSGNGGQNRVLVLEDTLLIAMFVQAVIEDCGLAVMGPAQSVDAALALIAEERPGAAILDINLGDGRVWPVAEQLQAAGVPFALATGYDEVEVPPEFRDRIRLTKPLGKHALKAALKSLGVLA